MEEVGESSETKLENVEEVEKIAIHECEEEEAATSNIAIGRRIDEEEPFFQQSPDEVIEIKAISECFDLTEDVEEKIQHVQDLQDVQSMDEQLEKVLDLDRVSLDAKVQTMDFDNENEINEISLVDVPPPPPCTPVPESEASLTEIGLVHAEDDEDRFLEIEQPGKLVDEVEPDESVIIGEDDYEPKRDSLKATEKKLVTTGVGLKKAGFKGEFPENKAEAKTDSIAARELKRQKAECSTYAGVDKFATVFVDDIIEKSVNQIIDGKKRGVTYGAEEQSGVSTFSSMHTYVEILGSFTRWPRIYEFTREVGEVTINEYINTWDYDEDWLYCIDFVMEQSDECSDYYMYEAKWSIPSNPYPVPQATASIYFTMEVSRIKPTFCTVDVSYVYEGSRFVHVPGKVQFQESWLFDIIDAKIELDKKIHF